MQKNCLHVRVRLAVVAVLALLSAGARAQSDAAQLMYWTRYQAQITFSPAFYWHNEIDNRRFIDPDVQSQLIMHSRLHYRHKAWDFGGGLTLSWTFSPDKHVEVTQPVTEIRPAVEATHESRFRFGTLSNRLRLDNRFFEVDKLEGFSDDYLFVARLRYRIQARVPVSKTTHGDVAAKIADEIMVNSKENLFDQNRIYASIDLPISKRFSAEVGYVYIYQQRFATDNFIQRHVMRFTLSHKFNFAHDPKP
jgi:hypothetical protein